MRVVERYGAGEVREAPRDLRQQLLTRAGQLQAPREAVEELHLQVRFQRLDVMADGRRGDVELVGSRNETAQPCRGLEGAESVERR